MDVSFTHSLSPLDWALLGVLAISVVVGLVRGIVFEVLSLAGWLVAYVVAQLYGAQLAAHLPHGLGGAATHQAAGFVLAFIGTLVLCTLLARLARALVAATPLSLIDRVLGAGFGLVRGLVVLLVATTLVLLTPAARAPWWQASVGAAWLGTLLDGLRPLLPAEYMRHLAA